MQRFLIFVAVCLLSGCLTAPPKEAAKPTLMPRAQSYRDLTHLPAPTGKIFVSVYNIQDETGQFKPYPASNFSTAVPQSATAMEGAIRVGAGDGVHMQVNGIHLSLLCGFSQG